MAAAASHQLRMACRETLTGFLNGLLIVFIYRLLRSRFSLQGCGGVGL